MASWDLILSMVHKAELLCPLSLVHSKINSVLPPALKPLCGLGALLGISLQLPHPPDGLRSLPDSWDHISSVYSPSALDGFSNPHHPRGSDLTEQGKASINFFLSLLGDLTQPELRATATQTILQTSAWLC